MPDFQALQNALGAGRSDAVTLFVFDLPFLDGYDLRDAPLTARRALLEPLLAGSDPARLRYSPDLGDDVASLIASACETAEGLIGKRADSRYRGGRSSAWIKLKCRRRQEFVIGGYTEPSGSRHGFGALLLGVYEPAAGGKRPRGKPPLRYVGRVGTGFDTRLLDRLAATLRRHERGTTPFDPPPRERSRTRVHWVEPTLVAECEFAEWTSDGIVRQAAFIALREDKPARQIVREVPRPTETEATMNETRAAHGASSHAPQPDTAHGRKHGARASASAGDTQRGAAADRVGRVRITHPERVLDPQSGTRKIDLAHYWQWVAPWLLPDLKGRPVSLVRARATSPANCSSRSMPSAARSRSSRSTKGPIPATGRCCRSTASMRCSAPRRWARSSCTRGTRTRRTSSGRTASCSTSIPIRRCRGAR